jgi:hypothetical protein
MSTEEIETEVKKLIPLEHDIMRDEYPDNDNIKAIWPQPGDVSGNIAPAGAMRAFDSGATRDTKEGKLEYEECLSPIVLEAYAEFMLECSIQSDGQKRPGDNWQKGIPIEAYMDSLLRHTFDLWKLHRGYKTVDRVTGKPVTIRKALCAILFNAFGYLHEYIKKEL